MPAEPGGPADGAWTQPPAPPLPPLPPIPPIPPVPPIPPGGETPFDGDLAGARDAAAGIAPAPTGVEFGVTKNADGSIRIVSRSGETAVIDPSLFRPEQVEQMVQTALEPPRFADRDRDRGPPEGVLQLIGMVLFFVTLMVVGFPLARSASRRMDRKASGAPQVNDLLPRLDRIEQAVEGVAIEVERVSEAQRFSARLLSERLPEVLPRLDAAAEAARRQRVEG